MKIVWISTAALLDGGAQFCALSRKFDDNHLEKLGLPELAITRSSGAIDGRELRTHTRVVATAQLEQEFLEVVFWALEDISELLFLGNNVMKMDTIDGPNRRLKLGGSGVEIMNCHGDRLPEPRSRSQSAHWSRPPNSRDTPDAVRR